MTAIPCYAYWLFWLALPCALAAQDFRLEDYEPAPFQRHYLLLEPQMNWNYTSRAGDRDSNSSEDGTGNGSGFGKLTYGATAWSPERVWDTEADFQVSANRYESSGRDELEGEGGTIGRNRFAASGGWLGAGHAQSRYRKDLPGNWFAEPWVTGGFSWTPRIPGHDRSLSRNPIVGRNDSLLANLSRSRYSSGSGNADVTMALSFGMGRIVDVGFASTAMFMLERAAAAGASLPRLDARGMRDLEAFLESRRKERPFLDKRRAAIYDMVSVERFLAQRDSSPLPAEALLSMADEWNNPSQFTRERGWEAKAFPYFRSHWESQLSRTESRTNAGIRPVGEDPGDAIRALESTPDSIRSSRGRYYRGEWEGGVGAKWDYRRPWRRRYQLDGEAYGRTAAIRVEAGHGERGDAGYPYGETANEYRDFWYRSTIAGAWASAAWIPDSRSYLRATADLEAQWLGDYASLAGDSPSMRDPTREISLRMGLEAHRELSPGFAAYANLSGSWRSHRGFAPGYDPYSGFAPLANGSDRNWDARLSCGLTYYLF